MVGRKGGSDGVGGCEGSKYVEGSGMVKGGMTGDKGVIERGYGGGVRVQGGIMRGDEDDDGGKDGGEEGRGSAWICSGFKTMQTSRACLFCSVGERAL